MIKVTESESLFKGIEDKICDLIVEFLKGKRYKNKEIKSVDLDDYYLDGDIFKVKVLPTGDNKTPLTGSWEKWVRMNIDLRDMDDPDFSDDFDLKSEVENSCRRQLGIR